MSIIQLLSFAEFWLSISLLAGVGVNLLGAWNFFRRPEKSAKDLGMVWNDRDSAQTQSTLILMRLAGVCLIALAMFYFVTALGPVQQGWSVVVAVLARLSGVIFYAVTLAKNGGPSVFKKYLIVNLTLAVVPACLLATCPDGLATLQSLWSSFFWVKFVHGGL